MGLMLKKESGVVRPWWYGEYHLGTGKRTVANLGVHVEGKPPASGRISEKGDAAFERSRKSAESALLLLRETANAERMNKTAALRQYQERTGEKLVAKKITVLLDVFQGASRWEKQKRRFVENFVEWAVKNNLVTVLDARLQHAKDYLAGVYKDGCLTASSVRKIKITLAAAFDIVLPEDARNPFRHPSLTIKTKDGDVEHHALRTQPAPERNGD